MSETDLKFSIFTQRDAHEVVGYDTTIGDVPAEFYIDVDGLPALDLKGFAKALRSLFDQQARDLGEYLHHADVVVTLDPATVQSWGLMHDCDECREGVRRALQSLAADPAQELFVGQLYWAGSPRPR